MFKWFWTIFSLGAPEQLNHATTYLNSACQHDAEITQSHTFVALMRLSTTTRNLRITPKNSSYWQINTSGLFSYKRLIQVPWCTVTQSADQHRPVFTPEKNSGLVKVHLQFCSSLIDLTPRSLFPRPKVQWSPRTIRTFLSQPGSGWLIHLAKWNENTTRYWTMQTLRIVLILSHLRALHDAFGETFLKVTNNEI